MFVFLLDSQKYKISHLRICNKSLVFFKLLSSSVSSLLTNQFANSGASGDPIDKP